MSSSILSGDAQAWDGAAQQLLSLYASLHNTVDQAHAAITGHLPEVWEGPAAAAFTSTWQNHRQRLVALTDLLAAAGSAVKSYGATLQRIHTSAALAEREAVNAGLHVAGCTVVMPAHFASLPVQTQQQLQHELGKAHNAIANARNAAQEAESGLTTELRPIVNLLNEWGSAAFAPDFAAVGKDVVHLAESPDSLTPAAEKLADVLAATTRERASQLGRELRAGGSQAGRDLPQAAKEARWAKAGSRWLGPVVGTVLAGLDVYSVDADHRAGESLSQAFSDHGFDLTMDLVGVATPVVVGAAIGAGVLAIGAIPAVTAVAAVGATVYGVAWMDRWAWDNRERLGTDENEIIDAVSNSVTRGVNTAERGVGDAAAGIGHAASNVWHDVF